MALNKYISPNVIQYENPLGEQGKIVSTSSDDSLDGTGTRKVKIEYFDLTNVLHEEIVTLNGTTPVLTVATDICTILYFDATDNGSERAATGTIKLTSTDSTRIFAQIDCYDTHMQDLDRPLKFSTDKIDVSGSSITSTMSGKDPNGITQEVKLSSCNELKVSTRAKYDTLWLIDISLDTGGEIVEIPI